MNRYDSPRRTPRPSTTRTLFRTFLAAALFTTAVHAQRTQTIQPDSTRGSYEIKQEKSLPDSTRTQLIVEIRDEKTNQPIPVRVIVTDSQGRHPDGSGNKTYADGRFFADEKFVVTIPPGHTKIHLRSGPNYVPLTINLQAKAGKALSVLARLHRWFSPEEHQWYAGDNHVHAQHDPTAAVKTSLEYTGLQARANGLSFITEAGSNVSYDRLKQLDTDTFLFRHAPELRPGCFVGHLNTPGIAQPIPKEQYATLIKTPLPALAITRAVHELGGAVIRTHPMRPPHQLHWMSAVETLSDTVLGQCADAFDVDSPVTELLWFTLLNMGSKLAVSSYTDCGLGRLGTLSPGDRRVYCHADEFSYRSFVNALRTGKTFATNGGPLFTFFTIDDRDIGDAITLQPDRTYNARINLHSLYPLKSCRLFRNGNLLQSFNVAGKIDRTSLTHSFREDRNAWYLIRAEDQKGHWAITSPIYFQTAEPPKPTFASACLLEISNATRFIELRPWFFAHLIVTVSSSDRLVEVHLLKDGRTLKRFSPEIGSNMPTGKIPATERNGRYDTGWIWHPKPAQSVHFQADWPIEKTGWYAVRATTAQGRTIASDAIYFNARNPNSHELSVAHLVGHETRFDLWGFGQEMPLDQIKRPFQGDHWWYPDKTYWRLHATFGQQPHELIGGKNRDAEKHFRHRQTSP